MEAKIDSLTLKEHNVDTFPNFYSGTCPDGPEWEDDLACVLHDKPDSRKQWREEFNNLIKYGPLDPQTFFIQGWIHDDIGQHIQDLFGEDWIDRFLRLGMLFSITYTQFQAFQTVFQH